jgi:hypothetical protein
VVIQGQYLFVVRGKSSVYGDCTFVPILQYHHELESGLDANNKWHIVCHNGSINHDARVLIVEDKVQVFPHPHLDTLGIIGVLHVQIFLQQTTNITDIVFGEEAIPRGD